MNKVMMGLTNSLAFRLNYEELAAGVQGEAVPWQEDQPREAAATLQGPLRAGQL